MQSERATIQFEEVNNLPSSLLISATYHSQKKKAVLKFYEPKSQKIYLWTDKTGHKPYCYSKLSRDELDFLSERQDVLKIEEVTKRDTLNDIYHSIKNYCR